MGRTGWLGAGVRRDGRRAAADGEIEAVERGSEHRGVYPVGGEIRGGVESATGPCPSGG